MSEWPYQYLFPYEKIPGGSRIVIYGAGVLGQDYLLQMQITHYCDVVAMADKNYAEYPPMVVPVISPEEIHKRSFDYIVVALRMAAAWNEVKRVLEKEGVKEEQIVCIFERGNKSISVVRKQETDTGLEQEKLAFSKSVLSVALLVTGGLGDMVIQKRLVTEMIRLSPNCLIDFYSIKTVDFLRYLYSDNNNINQVIPDLGSRYAENYQNYTLALTIEACHFIKVDRWASEVLQAKKDMSYEEFIRCINKLKEETDQEGVGITTPVHLTMIRRAYQGLHAYSGFNYQGAFSIKDKKVSLPLDKEWEPEFRKLQLERYITVNYGNGDCTDGSKVAKSWSKESFERLIACFRRKYPETVVQIGAGNSERLAGAGKYLLGVDFRLVVHVLKHSLLHIDIEGGLVHIATQLGTKCMVLFGPTVKEYYGYSQNINIQAGNCHGCWGLYSDVNRCARGMEKPECMAQITPELVMEHIDQFMADSVKEGKE